MYNDDALRVVDKDAANVLLEALASSKDGAGFIFQFASNNKRRFDLIIDVEASPDKDYYGCTDVVYSETTESFLFGADKFNVMRATAGLSLRISLNVSHANTSGQRLSTLVHEIGVHCTLIFGAIVVLNQNWKSVDDEQKMKDALLTQLEQGAYSADHHHTQFGGGVARDYNELKARVGATLDERGGSVISLLAGLVDENKWVTMKNGFVQATTRGEDLHEKVYWHPEVQYQELLKAAARIEQTTEEFNQRFKSKPEEDGLVARVKSFAFSFFE